MTDTVAGLLRRHAAAPDRIFAVLPGGDTITYAEQLARSRSVAAGLRPRGAQPGDRIHVMVTDANSVAVGNAVTDHLAVTAADRWLIVLPLFHANAQFCCTMSALVRGASLALPPRFSASGWARQARTMDATLASLFAAPVRMILAGPAQPLDGHNRLRAVLFAQNLTATDAATFERRFGTRLVQLYGMTETVLPPTMHPADEGRRWDSIGRAIPGITIDLVDKAGTVADCAAVGVADPIRNEAIVLVAVVRSGHELTTSDLLDWCAERLSAFKVPSFVVSPTACHAPASARSARRS